VIPESEVLSTPLDKRGAGRGFPVEGYARSKRNATGVPAIPGRAVLWNATDVADFKPGPVWGAYPKGFVGYALKALQCPPAEVLHVCSGMLTRAEVLGGFRVDLRAVAHPDLVCDGRAMPFPDDTFSGVLIDPPYSVEYARELYQTDYPRPSHLLKEAARVVRPGGRVGFLHFLVPMVGRSRLRFEFTKGVTQGCGYRIRAFTVFVKRGADLFRNRTTDHRPGVPHERQRGATRSEARPAPSPPCSTEET
jgi:SAM-dependent methyltransferase